MFFQFNTSLAPPYSILVDTNFLSHTIQHKLEIIPTMMDCLYAKCIPVITDCVLAELEKMGPKYRLALRVAKDPRFERVKCDHKGTYADDCIVDRVMKHRIYIAATNDRDLKRRIRYGSILFRPLYFHCMGLTMLPSMPCALFRILCSLY